MFRKVVLIACLNSVFLISACIPPCNYSYKHLYTEKHFTGRSVYDRTISLCPVLFEDGPDTTLLSEKKLSETLKKIRPDLKINSVKKMENAFTGDSGSQLLANFYEKLYKSDMVSLQTSESVWSKAQSDYLLVIRVKGGYSLKTFKKRTLKKIDLETELWNCRNMEVVWRGSVESSCTKGEISDSHAFSETVKRAFNELPSAVPSYDDNEW